jgi:hypothetical protein
MVKHALRTIVGVSTVPQYTSYSKFANSRSDSYPERISIESQNAYWRPDRETTIRSKDLRVRRPGGHSAWRTFCYWNPNSTLEDP